MAGKRTKAIGPREKGKGVTGTEQFGEHTAGEALSDQVFIDNTERDFTGLGTPGGRIEDDALGRHGKERGMGAGSSGNLGISAGRSSRQGQIAGGGAAIRENPQKKEKKH